MIPQRSYEVKRLPTLHGSQRFDFALLDPIGQITHRSWSRRPLDMKRHELQAAFDLGVEMTLTGLIAGTEARPENV